PGSNPGSPIARGSVDHARPVHVLVEGAEEDAVPGQLGEDGLRVLIDPFALRELDEEAVHLAGAGKMRNAEEELTGLLVLRDRLERLEIAQPDGRKHVGATRPGGR